MTPEAVAVKRQKYDAREERVLWEQYEQRKAELEARELSPADYFAECQRIADELGI